jgi:hypothetical protein
VAEYCSAVHTHGADASDGHANNTNGVTETQSTTPQDNDATFASSMVYSASAASQDDDVIASVMSDVGPELRDDEVIATDYARRAAVATQAKLYSEALFEELEAEAFAPMLSTPKDATEAYGKADVANRVYEKTEVDA